MKLSVVLVTRNEEELLEGCLSRLGFEDELIILDMHSSDRTVEIAEHHGARVVTIDPDPFVVRVRNIGLDEANGDWVLYLDPDEYVPAGLGDELREKLEHTDAAAYYMPFRPLGFGRTLYHGDVQDVLPKRRWFRSQPDLEATAQWPTKLCLFRAGAARWPADPPHNHVEPEIDGPIRVWDGEPIDHLLFRSVNQQLEKHIRYVTNMEPYAYGKHPLTAGAMARSLYHHVVVQQWWRDGSAGLAEAMLYTMKDWLVILQEWELEGHPESRMGSGTRAALATAEALHDLATKPRQAVAKLKRGSRRLAGAARR